MADEKEFRERIQEIGRLIAGLDGIADEHARTSTRALVQLVMELHGAGIERMMEITFSRGAAGAEIIDQLGADPTVSSLLVLHGLHPEPMEARVHRAIAQLTRELRKQDVEVQLLGIDEGNVRILARTNSHACGSTTGTLRASIEESVFAAAPEVASLTIEGLEPKTASGFVGLNQLIGTPAPLMESKAGD
ncbi:MAG TPA: hypothetical protein VFR08_14565 [Candidatus Angelobacter sp.]|nr:hypothetical protein [Candidatus Angelobacter sp.]